MDLDLKNKVAVIVGGSKGIGKGIAKGLSLEGANICLVARNEAVLTEAAAEIRKLSGGDVVAMPGDVSDASLAHVVKERCIAKWGRVDILVNNAGGPPPGSFLDHTDEVWYGGIDLNLMSVIRFTREFVPEMKKRRWGRIINITSSLAKEPTAPMVLSATVRAGVSAFSKAVASELAADGITINTLMPGGVKTDRLVSLFTKMAEQQGEEAETLIKNAEANIPLGYFADPDEFAQTAVFLASERGGYVTGVSLAVDGGLTKSVF